MGRDLEDGGGEEWRGGLKGRGRRGEGCGCMCRSVGSGGVHLTVGYKLNH